MMGLIAVFSTNHTGVFTASLPVASTYVGTTTVVCSYLFFQLVKCTNEFFPILSYADCV